MEKSGKQKTTAGVSLKDSLSDWKELVLRMNEERIKRDFKFWEQSWNEDFSD